jgi:hypothetical protein
VEFCPKFGEGKSSEKVFRRKRTFLKSIPGWHSNEMVASVNHWKGWRPGSSFQFVASVGCEFMASADHRSGVSNQATNGSSYFKKTKTK